MFILCKVSRIVGIPRRLTGLNDTVPIKHVVQCLTWSGAQGTVTPDDDDIGDKEEIWFHHFRLHPLPKFSNNQI